MGRVLQLHSSISLKKVWMQFISYPQYLICVSNYIRKIHTTEKKNIIATLTFFNDRDQPNDVNPYATCGNLTHILVSQLYLPTLLWLVRAVRKVSESISVTFFDRPSIHFYLAEMRS